MKERAMDLGLRILRLSESLPKTRVADIIARQLIRCGTSVGANYRAACRAKSRADFIAKMGIVLEECDEVLYWLEVLTRSETMKEARLADLKSEANEILAIVVTSIKTARSHK